MSGTPVPYCYDSSRFHPGPARATPPPVLLTVSRLEIHKNQEAVLRAAALLGDGVQVRLIGRGPEEGRLRRLGPAGPARFRSRPVPTIRPSSARIGQPAWLYSKPIRGIRPGPDRGTGVGNAGCRLGHPCPSGVHGPSGPPGFAGRSRRHRRGGRRALLPVSAPDPSAVDHLTIPAAAGRLMARLTAMLR